MQSVKVDGMEELLKKLNALPDKVQNSILTGAIRAGAKLVADEARSLAPSDSGILKKSIGVKKKRSKMKTILWFVVAPISTRIWTLQDRHGKKHYNYGRIVEQGKTDWQIEHGTASYEATPYMRPAFERKGEEAIDATRKYMAKRFDKEMGEL